MKQVSTCLYLAANNMYTHSASVSFHLLQVKKENPSFFSGKSLGFQSSPYSQLSLEYSELGFNSAFKITPAYCTISLKTASSNSNIFTLDYTSIPLQLYYYIIFLLKRLLGLPTYLQNLDNRKNYPMMPLENMYTSMHYWVGWSLCSCL